MKLQGLSVMFALIVIPLILVLTYYIQLQVDTITLQNQYDSDLLAATHDAMSAFEINTANEDLSTVSDSLRTIIEASSNIFMNTLATNLGLSNASKAVIEPKIPALLYTLYDGYYIYAPTKVLTIQTDSDGNAVYVGDKGVSGGNNNRYTYTEPTDTSPGIGLTYDNLDDASKKDYGQLLYVAKSGSGLTANVADAKLETKNVLKTYMPYSARYIGTSNGKNVDVTVVYTLDNYLTIEGSIGKEYYTKSGYLIPADAIEEVKIEGISYTDVQKYNENSIQNLIEESGKVATVKIKESDGSTTTFETTSGMKKSVLENEILLLKNQIKAKQEGKVAEITDPREISEITQDINDKQYELDKISATVYYTKAKIFSDWVIANLSGITESNLVEISGQKYMSINGTETILFDFKSSDKQIFSSDALKGTQRSGVTEIYQDSAYYTHKLNVIRNSIQYNLNLTMSTYNENEIFHFEYEMPVLSNDQWERILSNISLVSFMQGLSCGLKTYSNYMIVSSNNNEITVPIDNIYYAKKETFNDENSEYHKINCPKFIKAHTEEYPDAEYIAFKSKEVKYDKIYDKMRTKMPYEYDHKNLACYQCINDGNYEHINIFENSGYENLRKAFYIAVGKERNNIYKMNAIEYSEGYEVIYDTETSTADRNNNSQLTLDKIKEIEIVIGTINTENRNENTASYKIGINGLGDLNDEVYSIPTNSSRNYTIKVSVDPLKYSNLNTKLVSLTNLNFTNVSSISTVTYKSTVPDGEKKSDFAEKNNDIMKRAVKYIRVVYK